MLELRIYGGIGNIASRRNIEIVHRERIAQARAFPQHRRDMTAIRLPAEILDGERLERKPREHYHAVIALLTVQRDIGVAQPLEALQWKAVVRTFGFLQAQHVRPYGLDELGHEIDAQADGIDVPGGDLQLHGRTDRDESVRRHAFPVPNEGVSTGRLRGGEGTNSSPHPACSRRPCESSTRTTRVAMTQRASR